MFGHMQFTLIPLAAYSIAAALTIPTIAILDAIYDPYPAKSQFAEFDAVHAILPPSRIYFAPYFIPSNAPMVFTLNSRS